MCNHPTSCLLALPSASNWSREARSVAEAMSARHRYLCHLSEIQTCSNSSEVSKKEPLEDFHSRYKNMCSLCPYSRSVLSINGWIRYLQTIAMVQTLKMSQSRTKCEFYTIQWVSLMRIMRSRLVTWLFHQPPYCPDTADTTVQSTSHKTVLWIEGTVPHFSVAFHHPFWKLVSAPVLLLKHSIRYLAKINWWTSQ